MKVLLLPGSLRKESFNAQLLATARRLLPSGVETTLIEAAQLRWPLYDGDIEAKGIPQEIQTFGALVTSADALIVASPEYNGSIASPLKNTIDWVSRLRPVPWEEKPVLLMSASPGGLGGMRAFSHTRVPFDGLGSYVYPTYFSLGRAHEACSGEQFKDEKKTIELKELLTEFLGWAKKLKS